VRARLVESIIESFRRRFNRKERRKHKAAVVLSGRVARVRAARCQREHGKDRARMVLDRPSMAGVAADMSAADHGAYLRINQLLPVAVATWPATTMPSDATATLVARSAVHGTAPSMMSVHTTCPL
jgi:hypothetical protein